jgi:hypothetical protein
MSLKSANADSARVENIVDISVVIESKGCLQQIACGGDGYSATYTLLQERHSRTS